MSRVSAYATALIGLGWFATTAIWNRDALRGSIKAFSTNVPFHLFHAPDVRNLVPLILVLLLFAAAVAVGRLELRSFRVECSHEEEFIFGLGLGLGTISMLGLLLAATGLYSVAGIRIILPTIGLAAAVFNAGLERRPAVPTHHGGRSGWLPVISCILLLLVGLNLAGALGPEIFYDCLVYHLALPKLYLINHRLIATPYNIYSGVPLNTEMLYGLALALGGESAAKLIPWATSISLLAAVFFWARRHAGTNAALLATLIFYSFPMNADLTWRCYVELSWCLYAFLAIYALTINTDAKIATPHVALSGIFCGLCIGTKYNAGAIVVIVLGLLLLRLRRREFSAVDFLRYASIAVVIASALAAPWLIKNFVLYKNPIFPFLNDRFLHAPKGIDWPGLAADAKGRDLRDAFTNVKGFLGLFEILRPRISTVESYDFGYTLYLFLPWLFLPRWTKAPVRDLAATLLIAAVTWALYTTQVRFLLFATPMAAILLAAGICHFDGPRWLKNTIFTFMVAACVANACQIFINWQSYGTWGTVFGLVDRETFLSHVNPAYPAPPYPAIDYVNHHSAPDARVLFLGDARAYHLDRDFVAASPFAENPLIEAANDAQSADALAAKLKEWRIKDVIVNRAEMIRTGGVSGSLTPTGGANLDALFQKHATRVFERKIVTPDNPQWTEVYELKD